MKWFPARWMFWKWRQREACHGHRWCCQRTDTPMCNSWGDPHRDARRHYRAQALAEKHREGGWE